MSNALDKKLLLVSVLLHVGIVVFFALITSNSLIKKTFLVFGSHSRYQSHTYFHQPRMRGLASSVNGFGGSKGSQKKGRQVVSQTVKTAKKIQETVVKKKQESLNPTQMVKEKSLVQKGQKKSKLRIKREEKQLNAPVKKEEEKKSEANKIVPPKKQPKKVEEKKSSALKENEEKKEELHKPIKEEKFIEQEKPDKSTSVEDKQQLTEDSTGEQLNQGDVMQFNLMGETDASMLAYQQSIQHEVERLWHPPIGVVRGTECVVNFVIGNDGNVKEFNVVKPSRMVIYDLSIVRVARNFLFDKILWGKSFTINFRQ